MLLVIPAITIRGSLCEEAIGALLPFDEGYLPPNERAQLLRKENAKALHLVIEGEEEWCDHALAMIRSIKSVVDVPTAVSLHTLPDSMDPLDAMVAEGIYRIVLPPATPKERVTELLEHLSPQRVVPSVPLGQPGQIRFEDYKQIGVQRIALLHADDTAGLDWSELEMLAENARTLGLRLTVVFGIRSYAELRRLDSLAPTVDSLVLGHALEEDVFPCQKLWRSVEVRFGSAVGAEANLWVNPLKELR
jgi:phosphoribosylformimino-5-aminoimidazole carboxamide ribonucleotide (ProFAR) isomerase